MKNKRKIAVSTLFSASLITSLLLAVSLTPVSAQVTPPLTLAWYQKPSATDYALSGVPDFDQRQDAWINPQTGKWSYCGPVAVANSLWWWDSFIDGGKNNYSTVEDHFPLVQNYGPWDDHDPRNVGPFIQHLAALMQTDIGKNGTNVYDMEEGINLYLEEKGLNMSFYERTWDKCNYEWENVTREFEKSEDIIFLLGFYQDDGFGNPVRVGGHYVTVAGIGNDTANGQPWVKLSDPILDMAETMGLGLPYVNPPAHGHPLGTSQHNDTLFVSHDPYPVFPGGPLPNHHISIPDYPVYELYLHEGLVDNGEVNATYDPLVMTWTAVDAVVVFSPKQYDKPAYPDYAPSKMPDFDQRQDAWIDPYGRWSWCGPTALANSLWWFDSKFEPGNTPPPTYSDGFPLVQNYGPWDDHDPRNVGPLISELAWLADTDGMRTGIPHNGTYVWDLENATRWYLERRGLNDTFYERTWHCNFTFADIEYEVEQSEDVVLLLGFYEWRSEWVPDPEGGHWYIWMERIGGHYVTVSGVNANGTIKFSDPALDAAEWGITNGEVLPAGHVHPGLAYSMLHNDTLFVSHDYYTVTYNVPFLLPEIHWGIYSNMSAWEGYPWWELYDIGPNGNASAHQGGEVFVGVEYAVVVSPQPHGPTANFTESKHTADVNETIDFDASGSLPGFNAAAYVPIANYTWDFGDTNVTTVTVPTISHSYNASGNYTVTLNVTTIDDPILIANGLTQDSVSANKTINPVAVVHDVAVIDVKPWKRDPYNHTYTTWGASGGSSTLPIDVTVQNLGTASESFSVSVRYNNGTLTVIQTKPVVNLGPGLSTTLTFSWAVGVGSGMAVDTYTISANASTVPGETNTANNQLTDGNVKIHYGGDANGDGFIGGYDATLVSINWWSNVPPAAQEVDFNEDGFVGGYDATIISINWWTNVPKP